jgi:hypothetical protein
MEKFFSCKILEMGIILKVMCSVLMEYVAEIHEKPFAKWLHVHPPEASLKILEVSYESSKC